MMEVVVTTGAVRRAKLQSNRHHQQTNTQLFTGRCLSCRLVNGPIVSENYTHQVQQLHLDLCPFQSITWWEPFLQPCWTRVQSIKKSISVSRLLVTEEKCYRIPWTFSSQPHRVFQRCLWPLKVPDHIGEGCQASRQPCDATTPIKALSVNIIHSRVLGCNTTRPSIRPSVRSCVCASVTIITRRGSCGFCPSFVTITIYTRAHRRWWRVSTV